VSSAAGRSAATADRFLRTDCSFSFLLQATLCSAPLFLGIPVRQHDSRSAELDRWNGDLVIGSVAAGRARQFR
jgi:hypothetical protein